MPQDATAETSLIARARVGEPLAVHQLLLMHHGALLAEIRSHIPAQFQAAIAAEDMCQEAYIAAIRHLPEFDDRKSASFYGWLRVIGRRKLTDAIRSQRTAKRGGGVRNSDSPPLDGSSTIALLQLLAVDERTPSASAARREAVDLVRVAMDRLAPDYRRVLELRFIEGLDIAESAAKMQRAEGALRMLCRRALEQLAEEVGDPARILSFSR